MASLHLIEEPKEGHPMEVAEQVEVLIVDDDKATSRYISMLLEKANYLVTVAHSAEEAISLLKNKCFPLILSDMRMGKGLDGMSLIPEVKQLGHQSVIIFMTGYGSMENAVKALHDGAFEYISKPADLAEMQEDLLQVLGKAVAHLATLKAFPDGEQAPVQPTKKVIIGKSSMMVKVYRAVARASLSRGNVLIMGQSGTGKELIAHAIHDTSPWRTKPFVTVNCCALTETLLESELFGHIKGSFTGATMNKKGLFEEADGGTIFLDEIGDISPVMQVKLLRVIQEGEIKPVGSTDTRKVDVRVIAATHRNLESSVEEGKFREDLYYRLKVFLIEVPPLRDRASDLPELIEYFVARSASKHNRNLIRVSEEAKSILLAYHWPGNIRELENTIERAVAMSNTTTLFPEDFPLEHPVKHTEPPAVATASPQEPVKSLEALERSHISNVLRSVHYNKSKAAEILGIDRGTLYRKASRYGISLCKPADEHHA